MESRALAPVQVMSDGAILEGVTQFEPGQFPSLHHRREAQARQRAALKKEGWPSDKIHAAKPPLTRGRGGFPLARDSISEH